ncbi:MULTISPECIES: hypothetical protein [Acetobacter]|uniref:hypothetical protein n=1 Tax=Acetobacter TaxID=434 RepID=UPI000A364892|nr:MULTISPECIES: hypothetical protein [Acetobacter]MBS0981162.1 hypothetical protein [Acetobacter thailandicus]MBS0986375.1 hypothetical protein [Acetobacter thailandicus]MBS1003918.1 hypothetical protein [Acetobacter thailandicus]OUI87857.1 hypothetical protein HK11_09360 [Acetobacter sp. DmW_043]OUJ10263.1 hypothetical protein HK25_07705 [Acetobacter sp. DsW_059]
MNTAALTALLSLASTLVSLAEQYGPEIYTTFLQAVEQSKSGTGPTADEIRIIFEKCKADNASIQKS